MLRKPAVAGSFYPTRPQEIKDLIDRFLKKAKIYHRKEKVKAVISPHAGYIYAGVPQVSSIFSLPENTKKIILLGPAHYYYFDSAALFGEGAWQTPMGVVKIDSELTRKIFESSRFFKIVPEYHLPEHSLEVLLPIIQYYLGHDFSIVPILFGQSDFEKLRFAAETFANVIKDTDKLAIIISSDLYHGYSYEEGIATDKNTIDLIIKMNAKELFEAAHQGRAMACGLQPIIFGLELFSRIGIKEVQLLYYTNSLDVIRETYGYFVGYASIAFIKNEKAT